MDAFAGLFEGLRPIVYAVACRLVGPDDAEDVVMETYLKAWQAIPQFAGRSKLKTWLYRIARNCALDLIRRRSSRKELSATADDDGRDMFENTADAGQRGPDEEAEATEVREAVEQALSELPEFHRATLELRLSDGLSYAEIASATGVSIGTVMSRIFNGKRKLRRLLAERGMR